MTAALAPGKYEVTMEKLILAFAWAADEAGISQEARNDAAWCIMRAWWAVLDCGGWPTAPATRDLPPAPPVLTVVRDPEPASDRALLEELQGNVRSLMASLSPAPSSDIVQLETLRPRKTDREIIEAYVVSMRRRNLAPTTIEVRGRFFRQFLRAMGCGFAKVTREKIERWLDSGRKGPMLGARARRWRLSTLDVFYRWAVDEGLLQDNPAAKIAKPKLPQAMPRPMRDADLILALEKATPEMRCWLLLGAYEGLRCCEIAGLDREDVLEDVGQLRVTQGKGSKERMLPLHPDVLAALQALPMRPAGALFRRPRCLDRCPPYVVSQRISAYLVSIGLEHTGAHQLRHWFGVHTYRANADLLLVQKLLGHSSPGVTANYAAADPSHAAPTVAGLHVGP